MYGAGNEAISARIGIDTFGVFLHLGGSNIIPLTYVDNCADAIVLAALTPGIDGEVFNVVDDQLPSSRQFLRLYKKRVKRFTSIYLPHFASYALCSFWEWYSNWSYEQLPPVFNRRRWSANWKRTRYTNQKLKTRVGWSPENVHAGRHGAVLRGLPSQRGAACLRSASSVVAKIADAHAAQLRRIAGCEIVGVCDREPLMARQLYERYPVKACYGGLAELLAQARPDVVHVTTPPASHFDIARQCLEAGCHVYVESRSP